MSAEPASSSIRWQPEWFAPDTSAITRWPNAAKALRAKRSVRVVVGDCAREVLELRAELITRGDLGGLACPEVRTILRLHDCVVLLLQGSHDHLDLVVALHRGGDGAPVDLRLCNDGIVGEVQHRHVDDRVDRVDRGKRSAANSEAAR